MTPFVSAAWSDLLIVSYAVPERTLEAFLPPGLVLDAWNGQAHVSLVAFHFHQTRLLGLPLPPGLDGFPQWNLRFYVKAKGGAGWADNERGIVFLREFVPNPIVAASVRALYNEPYQAAPLTLRSTQVGSLRRVRYDLQAGGGRQTLAVSAHGLPSVPAAGSQDEFFTGQGWGCGQDRAGQGIRFHVTHPPWRVYDIDEWHLSVEFGRLYGPGWAFLQGQAPASVILCEGSPVAVSRSLRFPDAPRQACRSSETPVGPNQS